MQSFLFRYPISKLTSEEAAQVELLITTLTLQKPILKAGDIFTVGTRLMASVSYIYKYLSLIKMNNYFQFFR